MSGGHYDPVYLEKADKLLKEKRFGADLCEVLPGVLCAGASEAVLTEEGARLIDPSGRLKPGVVLCPPEGDAGRQI